MGRRRIQARSVNLAEQRRRGSTVQPRDITYAVTTTKSPKGTHFAKVQVATDGDHVAPQRYEVFTFTGEIPPGLR